MLDRKQSKYYYKSTSSQALLPVKIKGPDLTYSFL